MEINVPVYGGQVVSVLSQREKKRIGFCFIFRAWSPKLSSKDAIPPVLSSP